MTGNCDHHHHDHGEKPHECKHVLEHGARPSALLVELREHVPFSVSAVAIGLIVAGAICILGSTLGAEGGALHAAHGGGAVDAAHVHDETCDHDHEGHDHGPPFALLFFHLFHPAHMLFSAAATAAMYMRFEGKILKAVVIGLIGAIGVCGVSDIAMPHVSLMILGTPAPWHICVIEHPQMVLPFACIGVLLGIATAGGAVRSTLISHSLHVLASTMASIFYMVGPLGVVAWIDRIGAVFLFVVLAVMIPCCLSDIVFPLLMSKSGREAYAHEPHQH